MRFTEKVYRRLIISYVVVFLIPMVLNIFSLRDIRYSAEKDIYNMVQGNMEDAGKSIDEDIHRIEEIIEQLSNNKGIRYLATRMRPEQKDREITRLNEVRTYMKEIALPVSVDECYLYLERPEIVLSLERIFTEKEAGDYFLKYDMGNSDSELKKIKEERVYRGFLPSKLTMYNGRTTKKILYTSSMVSDSGKLGTFVFLIDSDKIEKLFRDIYIPSSGWIYVEDMNGKTILEIPSENGEFQIVPQELIEDEKMVFQTKLKKEKVCVIRQKSKKTGLVYTAVLPKRYLSGEIRQKQTQFTGLMVLVGITGVAAILLISYLRGKNLHSIMNQNRKLNEEMKRQEPVVRGLLIEKMLKSDKAVIPQVIRNLNKYGVSFSEMQRFVVIMFEFSKDEGEEIADIQKLELCKLMLNEKLSVIFGKKFHVCNPEVSKSVMIFEISAEVGDIRGYYQETFEKLTAYFLEEYEVILDITVGSACNSVNEVHKSYDEIQEIAGYQKEQGYHIFYYDDYKGQMFFYYYPMTVEERLMNAVRLGDATVMHNQLKQIYTVNVLERNLSFSMMHFLINEMQCTIFKLLHSVECAEKDKLEAIYNEIERINQEKDLLIRFQMVTEVFKTLCGQAVEQNKSRDEQSVKEIKKYIDLHYSEAGMGLAQTAEEFGYASAYFSRRFKALFGETFVSYVENVRIQHVCEMLETNMTLEKIAEQTGYNSADVMRSAFKKKKGCTPNEWRKLRETAD